MTTPTSIERALGHAIDLGSFEQYLRESVRPITDGLLDSIDGHDWQDLIEAAFNQLAMTVTLAQIAPYAPRAMDLAKAIAASSEEVTGAILLGLALDPETN
jgi:hypothetical protein